MICRWWRWRKKFLNFWTLKWVLQQRRVFSGEISTKYSRFLHLNCSHVFSPTLMNSRLIITGTYVILNVGTAEYSQELPKRIAKYGNHSYGLEVSSSLIHLRFLVVMESVMMFSAEAWSTIRVLVLLPGRAKFVRLWVFAVLTFPGCCIFYFSFKIHHAAKDSSLGKKYVCFK